ncbi:MAG: DUF4113 domain-containing protein [Thiobacillus sp.]|nr:DUF4113 domain-containing protein [Thiobacillus sp.]
MRHRVKCVDRLLGNSHIDRANAQWGQGTLRLASEGVKKAWQMRRERVSPAYTTRWEDCRE